MKKSCEKVWKKFGKSWKKVGKKLGKRWKKIEKKLKRCWKKVLKSFKKIAKKLEKKLEKSLKECSQSKNSFWVQKISNVELKKKKKLPQTGIEPGTFRSATQHLASRPRDPKRILAENLKMSLCNVLQLKLIN